MTIKELVKSKVYRDGGVEKINNAIDEDRDLLINDEDELQKMRIKEYNLWYDGDGDELLNFYTHSNMWEYNYEPFYDRNKRNYFWAISSTESDIKRTHSGQPRNIVDTLVNIMRFPLIKAGSLEKDSAVQKNLDKILKESEFKTLYAEEQMPLTLIEGWGCYKINWNTSESEYPYAVYYRADNVDFIYKANKVKAIIFKDYYTNGKDKKYLLCETRRTEIIEGEPNLVIENELYLMKGGESLEKVAFNEVEQLKDTPERIVIGPTTMLLAVPTIFFKNITQKNGYGRSIFCGKLDLFDDLDQCLSQSSNSVRKSTPIEYFNSEYLERDAEGLPIQPTAYDRKYTIYTGQRDANGAVTGSPVEVTQPQLNLAQYNTEAQNILLQIVNGIMSPATLGIDIAKKDNAEAQREKEKVTIFTRNMIIDKETVILEKLFNQLLCAYEFIKTGKITVTDYDVAVKYSEFADDSFETKIEKLGAAFDGEIMSEDMFMSKLYGDTLNHEEYERELQWLKDHHTMPRDQGMQGIAGGGENIAGMLGMEDEE